MEIAVIAETEQIQFEALAFDHQPVGNVRYPDLGKIRLPRYRAEAGEFGTIEPNPVIVPGMPILKRLQHLRGIIVLVLGFSAKSLQFIFPFHIFPPDIFQALPGADGRQDSLRTRRLLRRCSMSTFRYVLCP